MLWTAGSNRWNQEGSLANLPTKGYRPLWAVDQTMEGSDKRGKERREHRPEQWPGGGTAIADGKNLAGARETRPRGLGLHI